MREPRHGDVWEQRPFQVGSKGPRGRFSVMTADDLITGYWWSGDSADPELHDTIPRERFREQFVLVEREGDCPQHPRGKR